ncbi:zinc ribbon domain-containing protein [Alkalihalobacillus sp. NPDC078783]
MTCAKCGTALPPESKFCEQCGEQIEPSTVQTEEASTVETTAKPQNETVEKVTALIKNYWTYFLSNLKAPTQRGFVENQGNVIFATINVALIAFFFAFTLYAQLGFRMDSYFGLSLSFSESFIPGFFFMLIFLAIIIGGLFLTLKLVTESSIALQAFYSRFGESLVVPVALSVLAFISGLIGIGSVTSLFLGLLFLTLFAIMIMVYQTEVKQASLAKFDPLYGLVALFAVTLILLNYVSSYMLAGMLMSLFV